MTYPHFELQDMNLWLMNDFSWGHFWKICFICFLATSETIQLTQKGLQIAVG